MSAQLPPPGTHLAFDARFEGPTLDTDVWDTCYPWATGSGCTNFANAQEQEWYLPAQAQVAGGALQLTATREPTAGVDRDAAPKIYPYRSGMVTTHSSFNFTYGYVQIVARLPKGPNFWPALWLLPASQQALPEIDIIENWGSNPRQPVAAFHPLAGLPSGVQLHTADLSSGWHRFGLNWQPGSITWYVDGHSVFTITSGVPHVPMYLLANLAVTNYSEVCMNDATATSARCSGSLAIRSVAVWQQ